MSLKKRLVSNGLASVLQKGVRVLEQLFLVPFFISAWGAAYYGEWLTLTIIPSVIAFSDLGFGTAAANSFVLSYAAGDKQKAANISKTGISLVSAMVLLAMFISILVVFILKYFNVFEKALIDSQEAMLAVSILILARLLNFYTQLIEAYYRSAQRAALSINLLTLKAALNLGAGLIVLLMGYGVVEFAVSQLVVILLFNFVYWLEGRKVLGLHKEYSGSRDLIILKNITNKGLGYLMSPIWQAIYFQGTTFAVRIVLGPEAVAVFNTVRTLSRSLNQVFFMVKGTVFPELQFEVGQKNWKTAQKVFRISIISVFLMSFLGFIFLLFFGLWFYNIWTNNELVVPKAMWYIFISGMLFNAIWWTAEMVFSAINEPKKIAIYGLFVSIISVTLTYVLSKLFGITGAAIGAVSLDVILLFWIVPNCCRVMHMSVNELITHGFDDLKTIYAQVGFKVKQLIS